MALDLKTFRTRTLTAIVFAIVMLSGLLINPFLYRLLFATIMLGCLFEFIKITRLITGKKYSPYLAIVIPYIILPLSRMTYMGTHNLNGEEVFSPLIPCGIIFSIWINDTSAYIVGSLIGRTPLSAVSPKKTWEGTLGGILLCCVIISLLGANIPYAKVLNWTDWAAIAALCGVFGTFGDLVESKLKRTAGIKDSGNFMPGHGGFLDRFDSLLFAVPFVWVYLKIFL